VYVKPAIVIVPWRAAPELAATLKVTPPFPLPFAPDAIEIQEAPVVEFQGQVLWLAPEFALTATVPVPPLLAMSVEVDPR
jgi:hypothetical protein